MFFCQTALVLPMSRRVFSSSSHDLASTIAELNKEMEFVFGEAPPTNLPGSSQTQPTTQDPHSKHTEINNTEPKLTHVNVKGEAEMVDVSHKDVTKRIAVASCKVLLGRKAFELVSANQVSKGDVLGVAKIAGITGAKQTSSLIPLCHNIDLTHVRVDLRLNLFECSAEIEGEAASTGKQGSRWRR